VAPGIGDLAALDHEVVDRALGEAPAHGEAGMTGPDHNCRSRSQDSALCLLIQALA